MWYTNSYRRHLCDMHIDDWDESFLSEFRPEVYFENLKKANIQNAMLYAQSHVGLSYYPTPTGKMHNAFRGREDSMRKLAQLCRDNGISVTMYYSLIYNNWAHDHHPQWRMVMPDGKSAREASREINSDFGQKAVFRYGLCCPNNRDYRAFVVDQIREIAEYFSFDGMFFDMLFWAHPCYCPACRERWKAEVGGELPETEDWADPKWLLHMEKRREWMGEFARFAVDTLHEFAPHASVEHNVAYAGLPDGDKGNAEEVLKSADFAGGDLYGGIYNQSFICKFYRHATKNPPFEYMASRCTPTLAKHTTSKSEDTLQSEVFLTAAHHGATLLIDAIDPVGTMDTRVYEMFGRVFARLKPYERYFHGTMKEDVGLYYSLRSKFNAHGEEYRNHSACLRMVKTLVQAHIPCGVTGTLHTLADYPVLLAPLLTREDRGDFERLISYVENGGQLYLSGGDCGELLKVFFQADVVGRTAHRVVYVAPNEQARDAFGWFNAKYPLHIDGTAPILRGIAPAQVIATVTLPYTRQNLTDFVSIHSDPPGIPTQDPAVAVTTYGKGKVIWSGLPLEAVDNYNHSRVLLNLLRTFFTLPESFRSDAPKDVELTLFENERGLSLNAVLLNEDEYARPVAPFTVCVRCEEKPKQILRLPEEGPVKFQYQAPYATFTVENPGLFSMFQIVK